MIYVSLGTIFHEDKRLLEELIKQAVGRQVKKMLTRDELDEIILFRARDEKLYEQVDQCLSWNYAWDTGKKTKQKYSVTELKKLRMQEESDSSEELYPESDIVPLIPRFVEKTEEKGGAARGTVYHTIMECMDLGTAPEPAQVDAELQRLAEEGRITKEDLQVVRPADFRCFADSACQADAGSRREGRAVPGAALCHRTSGERISGCRSRGNRAGPGDHRRIFL